MKEIKTEKKKVNKTLHRNLKESQVKNENQKLLMYKTIQLKVLKNLRYYINNNIINPKNQFLLKLKLLNAQEVTSGSKVKYTIAVQTGSRQGSSTQARIKLKLFGDRNENFIKTTRWIDLEKSSTHKLPFQRGNKDVFEIEIFDIGKLIAITIGHVETEISKKKKFSLKRIFKKKFFVILFKNTVGFWNT